MVIGINAVLDTDMGAEIGARFFNRSSPASQVGADVVMDQNGTRTLLYEEPGLSDITVNTMYDVDLYRTDGAQTLTTLFTATECFVGADGGTYWLGTESQSALIDFGLDHLVYASVAGTDIADDSVIAQLVSASATADWDDFDNTTDSFEAIISNSTNGLSVIRDTAGHNLNILTGVISNAGDSDEQFNTTSWNGINYRAIFSGLDINGNRGGVTLSNP